MIALASGRRSAALEQAERRSTANGDAMRERITSGGSPAKRVAITVAATVVLAAPIVIYTANAPPLRAQTQTDTAGAHSAFEVVSVKPNPTFTGRMQGTGSPSPGVYRARNIPLRFLCRVAYDINSFNIFGGPDWIDSAGFDIDAKAPVVPGQSRAGELRMMPLMLRSALEDRFKLKTHFETREMPVYILTIAKSGLKMKPAPCDLTEPACQVRLREAMKTWPQPVNGSWEAMDRFLVGLATTTNGSRAIIDKTGLTGVWDMHMQWAYQPPPAPPDPIRPAEPADFGGESVFTAIEKQLGLHLESGKGPVNVLVIDHAEKPDPN